MYYKLVIYFFILYNMYLFVYTQDGSKDQHAKNENRFAS